MTTAKGYRTTAKRRMALRRHSASCQSDSAPHCADLSGNACRPATRPPADLGSRPSATRKGGRNCRRRRNEGRWNEEDPARENLGPPTARRLETGRKSCHPSRDSTRTQKAA